MLGGQPNHDWQLRVRLAPLNRFKPSSKIFYWPFQGGTSFVDLLCFCSVLCLLCFVRVCLYVLRGHLLGKGWPLGSRLWCLLRVCHFPIGILGQVWYLIVSIPDLCNLTYFALLYNCTPVGRTSDSMTVPTKWLIYWEMVGAWCLVCGQAHWGLPVGFLSLRYSVLFTVESLSLLYLLFISWFICSRKWCFDKLGVFHANPTSMCLDPHLN